MAGVKFIFDGKSVNAYVRQLKRIARKTPFAIKVYLNNQAFHAKKLAEGVIPATMTVRSKPFMRSSLRVQKAGSGGAMRMFSLMGSIKRPRFTGWREQEFGGKMDRTASDTARTGNVRRGRMRAKARLKPSNQFRKPSEMVKARGDKQKAQAFLQRLSREKHKDPFILFGHPKFKPGLYKLKGRAPNQKIITQQLFEDAQIKRTPWMKPTIRLLRTTWRANAQWGIVWKRLAARG